MFLCAKDGETHMSCTKDIINQGNNEEMEMLVGSLFDAYTTVGIVNLATETCKLIKSDASIEHVLQSGFYGDYLNFCLEKLLSPGSRKILEPVWGIEQLQKNLREGESMTFDFQIKNGSWRSITFTGVEYEDKALTKFVFFAKGLNQYMSEMLNTEKISRAEAQILDGIHWEYTLMTLIDLDQGSTQVYKSHDIPQNLLDVINTSHYKDSFKWFAEKYVVPDEYDFFMRVVDMDIIRKELEKSEIYSFTFHTKPELHNTKEVCNSRMLFAKPKGRKDSIVCVTQNLDTCDVKENESRYLREEVFRALSENLESIVYVDLEEGVVEPLRINHRLPASFWEYVSESSSYEDIMHYYINGRVHPEDRRWLEEQTGISYLRKVFKNKRAYSCDYRIVREGQEVWYRMKVANLENNGTLRRFMISYENIHEEKTNEIGFARLGNQVLIVENDRKDMEELAAIVEEEYFVYKAHDCKEAMEVLEKCSGGIDIILANMDVLLSTECCLIGKIRENTAYANIPIIALAKEKEDRDAVDRLGSVVADYIEKPYCHRAVFSRINSLVKLQQSTQLLNSLGTDDLTGLYTKEFFYQSVEECLIEKPSPDYFIHVIDIQNFKILNEKYGVDVGDIVLKNIAEFGIKQLSGCVIAGRLDGDRFACLRKGSGLNPDKDERLLRKSLEQYALPNVMIKSGYYRTTGDTNARSMCDRAMLALNKVKGKYGINYAEYDDSIRQELIREQMILENMDEALKTHQFQVYYQPKHNLREDRTGGAEALVRWTHPELGFINPGVFIPIFEKNGFITLLDQYVLEEVCKYTKQRYSRGRREIPISVNVSRRDLEQEESVQKIIDIVDKYGIRHDLIHLEVTESAYSDNQAKISQAVAKLHNLGFVIELDDFGVGYSSITMLNNMDLDVMKLDISIIRNDVPGSEKNILEFSMQLARLIGLATVAEGAETGEQVERLKSLGCDYVQGYFYAKPMPEREFDAYLNSEES